MSMTRVTRRVASRAASAGWRVVTACAASIAGARMDAQPSTAGLTPAGRPWTVEASAGLEVTPLRDLFGSYAPPDSRATAARLGLRRPFRGSPVAVRLDGWWVARRVAFQSPADAGAQYTSRRTDRLLGLGASVDLAARLGRHASLEPSVGVGFAPWVRGSSRIETRYPSGSTGPVPPPTVHQDGATEQGRLVLLGLAVRVRRVVVAQHIVVLLGARGAVPEYREYYPLTVGWRF